MLRQGDVLIIAIDSLPDNAVQDSKSPANYDVSQDIADAGGFTRVVLAHGEVTGHAHAFHRNATTYKSEDGFSRYLSVGGGGASLLHEEHSTIQVPMGVYRVIIQREYTPEEIRNVAD